MEAGENTTERLRRWRLILGEPAECSGPPLSEDDLRMDKALAALYEPERRGGLNNSAPNVARWLGDIRKYFPGTVVQVMQKDALERLNLTCMLLEPELLKAVEPDVHLAATLLALKNAVPEQTKETARLVVRQVVEALERKLANHLRQAVTGSLNRASRTRRPRLHEMDWPRTIRANLKHYQPDYHTIIPATRIGYGRRRDAQRQVILCIDQSGSMATSVVYSGVLGAVLASLPALKTSIVLFDTAVVDLTEELHDPVELLFGVQLGGGTDIHQALAYCQGLVRQPRETILVLISDLFEGGDQQGMLRQAATLTRLGVQMIVLLALNDDGAPAYNHEMAAALGALGVPVFACTPDLFPDLMAAAIQRQDISQWAGQNDLAVVRASA